MNLCYKNDEGFSQNSILLKLDNVYSEYHYERDSLIGRSFELEFKYFKNAFFFNISLFLKEYTSLMSFCSYCNKIIFYHHAILD